MQRRPSLTATKLIALADLIREHCKTEDGEAIYDEGWDDKKVALEADASYWTVRSLRSALLGQIRRQAEAGQAEPAEAWRAEIDRRLLALEVRGGDGAALHALR